MTRFEVFTSMQNPGLHVWKRGTNLDVFLKPSEQRTPSGAWVFGCELGESPLEEIRCQIFAWGERNYEKHSWEQEHHVKTVPRLAGGQLPPIVYLFHGVARALAIAPFVQALDEVRIRLITAARYMNARLFLWEPMSGETRSLELTRHTAIGPMWTVPLSGPSRSAFLFKFFRPVQDGWEAEGDYANRLWFAADGADIWTHSETRDLLATEPVRKRLTVYFRQEIGDEHPPRMHVWQEGSDFETDIAGEADDNGWSAHPVELYTGLPYRLQFWNPTMDQDIWEHPEAKRTITIGGDMCQWTLEGDRHLFSSKPERNCAIELAIAANPPGAEVTPPHGVQVWINRARAPMATVEGLLFNTYPDVVTSFRLTGGNGLESIDRHFLRGSAGSAIRAFVVPGRPPVLSAAPVADLFTDPPFRIKRPGAYSEDGQLRFVLHAPWCARVDVTGEWMTAGSTLPMRSTRDGTYWWAQIPVADVQSSLPSPGDYHGARYRFQFNGDAVDTVQDPAAGWVDGSAPDGWSRLVRRGFYQWRNPAWRTPAWDSLVLYQLHPSRFSSRAPGGTPFERAAWEIKDASGHLRRLGVTAIQLMPVNEVGTNNSWGYDPAFYYAVESAYGGPDALKDFVDTCHENGRAVLLDVIFNHAGTADNILWKTAQGSFFDGDTAWGAMVNYDHPQVIHFFEQNLIYLLEEYKVDGVRFDFTRVITRGHIAGEAHVRRPGSGGGWEFLKKMRSAMHSVNQAAILVAEHLPNEWAIVNFGGSMDSQWCDDFHDRLKEVCAGNLGDLPGLATALKLSHVAADDWYKETNYAESHDEVGNENGRIANVGGFGRGLRMSKLAMCVTLLSRGLPMMFMGAEAGEYRQFKQGTADALDLAQYSSDVETRRLRDWTNVLLELRKSNSIKGPSPLGVTYAQDGQLAFSRGQAGDYFVLANFTSWTGWKSLSELNLPNGVYCERWNSTWPAFQVEWEDEHTNGGQNARLDRGNWLHVPDYGVVVLERV